MEYVMVPVPDEFVVDVMQYVARLVARASVVPWTKESVEQLLRRGRRDQPVVAVVRGSGDRGGQGCQRRGRVAESLELSVREIRTLVRDINERRAAQQARADARAPRDQPCSFATGASVQRRLFVMNEAVARMIRARTNGRASERRGRRCERRRRSSE